jgi:uncharacterized protein with NAD-binding domain and iron-sulfur cluster
VPGDQAGTFEDLGPSEQMRRIGALLRDFVVSLDPVPPMVELSSSPDASPARRPSTAAVAVLAAGAMVEGLALSTMPVSEQVRAETTAALDLALVELRDLLAASTYGDDAARRSWHLVAVITAVARGLITDGVFTDPRGYRAINDEDFRDWIRRHGAPEEAVRSTFVRGLYDLAFAHVGGDPDSEEFEAGVGVLLSAKALLGYKGAIFWKMAAGMGEVVFAPLFQAMAARGVTFELFHRIDHLQPSTDGRVIEAVTVGRQAWLAPGRERYDPLVRVGGLPCFPDQPRIDQLDCDDTLLGQPLEASWCTWPDAEQRVLRRGVDFDEVVFAMPPPMAEIVCAQLIEQRPEWRRMVDNLATVATQAAQLWLRQDDRALGWSRPGTTVTGYVDGFDTWASMPQLIAMEDWPQHDRPGSIAYLCNTLADAPPPVDLTEERAAAEAARVRANAVRFCSTELGHLLPGAMGPDGFRWELLCGADGRRGEDAFDSQFWRANVDPSDRYVQSLPGSDRHRLRPDESGYANLVLAGDWTDNGLNAGCIEAAVLSGLQAANALLGRHRWHRIIGSWLP